MEAETEIETPAKPRSKKNGKIVELPRWWDGLVHPMTDAQFYDAFCAWVLVRSDDHSLKTVRDRAYRFIRQVMRPEMLKHLEDYRAEHTRMIEWFRLLRWQQWEGQLATLIWIASLCLAHWYPGTYWVVLATTINLLHSRYSSYFAGTTLQARVMGFLNDSLTVQQNRLTAMEKDVADVKEAQVKIAGAWRGRNLP